MVGVLTHPQLPLAHDVSVEVVDSHYSHAGHLSPVGGYEHHVVIARLAANRTLYRAPPLGTDTGPGYPWRHGVAGQAVAGGDLGPTGRHGGTRLVQPVGAPLVGPVAPLA